MPTLLCESLTELDLEDSCSERKRRLSQAKPGGEVEGKPLESKNLAHEPDGDFSPRLRSGQATRFSSFSYAQDRLPCSLRFPRQARDRLLEMT